jgi:hypothetical protein
LDPDPEKVYANPEQWKKIPKKQAKKDENLGSEEDVSGADVVAAEHGLPPARDPVNQEEPVRLNPHHVHANHQLLSAHKEKILPLDTFIFYTGMEFGNFLSWRAFRKMKRWRCFPATWIGFFR